MPAPLLEEEVLAEPAAPPLAEEPGRPAEAGEEIDLLGETEAPAEEEAVVEAAEETEEPSALEQAPTMPIRTLREQLAEPPPVVAAEPTAFAWSEEPPPLVSAAEAEAAHPTEAAGLADATHVDSETPFGEQRPEPGAASLYRAAAAPPAPPEWLREVTEAPEDWEAAPEEPER